MSKGGPLGYRVDRKNSDWRPPPTASTYETMVKLIFGKANDNNSQPPNNNHKPTDTIGSK